MSSAPFPELTARHPDFQSDSSTSQTITIVSTSTTSPTVPPSASGISQNTSSISSSQAPHTFSIQNPSGPPPVQVPTTTSQPGSGSSGTPLNPSNRHPTAFNPLIYGNDVDSVDVATRIAMVLHVFLNTNFTLEPYITIFLKYVYFY